MVYTLGESLLDILVDSISNITARPGGAMLNTAVSLGRSDVNVSLITELGDDSTSGQIISFLKSNNVFTDFIKIYKDNNTSLAIALLDENKKPKYTFIKNYPEDRKLSEIPNFNNGDILLFGSLYSLDKKIRNSILSIINGAIKKNATLIYDPNIRNIHHLKDKELMKSLLQNIKLSNIIKGSDEDFANIFGSSNQSVQISELRKLNKNALIIITLGADGVIADLEGQSIKLPAIKTKIISTIGAGDAFSAGIILALERQRLQNKSFKNTETNSVKDLLNSGLKYSAMVCNSLDNYIPKEI